MRPHASPLRLAGLVLALAAGGACRGKPIPGSEATPPRLIGGPATARPLAGLAPAHPHLARPGASTIHADGANSDVHPGPGPVGRSPEVRTIRGSTLPGGMCATMTFDSADRLVALCASIAGFEIVLMEPRTMQALARHGLPNRPSTFAAFVTLDPDRIMADTSGGAYFYLDDEDRVVLADSRQHVIRLAHRETGPGTWEFRVENDWDLGDHVPHDCLGATNWFPDGECDPVTAVLPDHEGRIWWVTLHGRIGTLDPDAGEVRSIRLEGEEIQNSFAVAADGVFIVSDHAMYAFAADADGVPVAVWRETYDRGVERKLGTISQGSGTTPTLLGDEYVVITDNADERVHLLVLRRDRDLVGDRTICRVPLFEAGASAVENSVIAWGRAIIVKNDSGYKNGFEQEDWTGIAGGITRVDVRADGSGCDVVWESDERVPSVVPKLSAASGLAYFYTYETQPSGENAWYLVAVDATTGATAYKVLTGVGGRFDGSWAPITLAPDGTAYVGTMRGLVAIRDGIQDDIHDEAEAPS